MATEYRVVFAGAVLDGYEIETVRQSAGHRLKVTPEQLVRLFSGKPVVLKKGLDLPAAEHYVAELNRIGMKARVEPVPATATQPQKVESYAAEPPPVPTAQSATPFPSLTLVDQNEAPAATPRPHAADLSNAPTYVIPKNQIEASRLRLEEALAAHDDLTRAPTVIVPSPQTADARRTDANAPTVVIPRQDGRSTVAVTQEGTGHLNKTPPKSRDSERTLIADEDALNAYLTNSSDPIGLLDPSGPDLPPVIPTAPAPLAATFPPIPELRMQPAEQALPPVPADESDIPPPPPIPFPQDGMLAAPEADPGTYPDDGSVTPPPPLPASVMPQMPPPVPPAQNRRALPKTLPQEAAVLARPERDTPAPSHGLTLPIKILLAVVLLGGIAGIGLLVWILVNA